MAEIIEGRRPAPQAFKIEDLVTVTREEWDDTQKELRQLRELKQTIWNWERGLNAALRKTERRTT